MPIYVGDAVVSATASAVFATSSTEPDTFSASSPLHKRAKTLAEDRYRPAIVAKRVRSTSIWTATCHSKARDRPCCDLCQRLQYHDTLHRLHHHHFFHHLHHYLQHLNQLHHLHHLYHLHYQLHN